jgi:GTPase SAR1 family protein
MIPFYYGCLIIGPSGTGKTTLCRGLAQLFHEIGRPFTSINLDPANELPDEFFQIDIKELITVEDAMKEMNLGYLTMIVHLCSPNSALLYCIDFLRLNFEWLAEKILSYKDTYLIFDFPGVGIYINSFRLDRTLP